MLVVLLFVQISSLAKRNCEENIKKESTQSCHCWYARLMAPYELFVYYKLILKKSNAFIFLMFFNNFDVLIFNILK